MTGIKIETRPETRHLRPPSPPPEDWAAAGWAGLYGGCVYLFVQLVAAPVLIGASPWAPVRFIAAIVLGSAVLPPPFTFDPLLLIVALTVNFTLSMLYTRALAPLWSRARPREAVGFGLAAGLVLFIVNFYALTEIFPWFKAEREWVTLLANAAFGAASAFVYKTLERRPADR